MDKEIYLGDGLYASFDGWQIRLRAPREEGDHVVYLEPHVLENLKAFMLIRLTHTNAKTYQI